MSHATTTVDRPTGEALTGAAAAAGHAPSILNTQPWRWRLEPGRLELFAERARQLTVTDPQGRLLTISCGAALHHARTALAAAGWSAHVARLPDAGQPDLLATLTVTGPTAVTEAATRLAQAIPVRHTDRRPVSDRPLPAALHGRHRRSRPSRRSGCTSSPPTRCWTWPRPCAGPRRCKPTTRASVRNWRTGPARRRRPAPAFPPECCPITPRRPRCRVATSAGPEPCPSAPGTTGPRSTRCCSATQTSR